ncbi:hypothetical protein Saro_0655 [Novosphingobium aromaticivorans DSM 12444]|uniref:DUF3168 domain-containing protein n=1 Tax=Novosphingobium aromaticivorans (strain ATCC 700278 / DSM 12444 / CCUG 56034 / CIP 105152 / NBRC 16084 / F199) TaxID=279238 RepID=Q2GAM1_NOVAD|nr:DUF3168 domain-containing protein [Novosphingobium aromaticivorans]ABD25102.1 hypothetical protein Saro_0655 [Novosphingobium aromaticivorans DSM 12444]SCY95815.1 Protein of unknown function [Novosphingobium aromaticivorans]
MSDGVATMVQLLHESAAVTGLVPAGSIGAGVLPLGTPLPYLSLSLVSSSDMNMPAPGAKRRVLDRVQVTIAAATYDELREISKAVKSAGADQVPDVDGISQVTVHSLGAGPDFMDETASIYLGSRDFRVWYNEVR